MNTMAMQQDIRETELYREVEAVYRATRHPGSGLISDGSEIQVSPDGNYAVFAGVLMERLEGLPLTRICQVDLISGAMRVLTFGPNTDCWPKYSPNGRHLAFLSDRRGAGYFQLYLLDPENGAAHAAALIDGWLEYLHWSPDGRRILLGVAGFGADVSSSQGSKRSKQSNGGVPSWLPSVDMEGARYRWRRAWVYDLAADRARAVGRPDRNVWNATWCGDDRIAAVVSDGPSEGTWYDARLEIIALETGEVRLNHVPEHQLGVPVATSSGDCVAIVAAVASDRGVVAGNVQLIESASKNIKRIDTRGVDISHAEWRSERHLLLAGNRGFETVVGIYDRITDVFETLWASSEISTGGHYVSVSGLDSAGGCALIGESFWRAPEIAVIRGGEYRTVTALNSGCSAELKAGRVEQVSWTAPDGLELQGWLLQPEGEGPFPLVMNIHGGPVWHWRPTWLSRLGIAMVTLLTRGYGIFLPNPRGGSGRGQEFARRILGDIGGADTQDLLSGIDHLIERGVADPHRLGVTGGSYGGYMTAWLITQDSRFRAAVAIAPSANLVSKYLISTIPQFVSLFYGDTYANPNGKFFQRSPIMHAHKAKTPTLSICGALDRTTPPAEPVQFHNALLENGIESVLVTYPEEGHGIKKLPEAIDCNARTVAWFEEHMQTSRAACFGLHALAR